MSSSINDCKEYIRRTKRPVDYVSGSDATFDTIEFYNSLGNEFPDKMKNYDITQNILNYRKDSINKKMFDDGVKDTLTRIELPLATHHVVDEKGNEMRFITFDLVEDVIKTYIDAVKGA